MNIFLLSGIILYIIIILAVAFYGRLKIKGEEDFLVAGRRLSLPLTFSTIFATWFGAGTLLTATEEIRMRGLKATALEPYGAGFCLIIAGIFFARPLWDLKLLTIADFFKVKFGRVAEELSIFLTWPGFVAWIAVQLMAASEVLKITFGLPTSAGIAIIGVTAMFYIIIGGMWSIALLDIFQIVIILVGLLIVAFEVLAHLGGGSFLEGLNLTMASSGVVDSLNHAPGNIWESLGFFNIFLIAALGNIPGQDFMQRVFSAKSAKIASGGCILAGILYISIGSIPVFLGLASNLMIPGESTEFIIITLSKQFVSPAISSIFILAILAAIFSTLDSSILAAASPLSHNFLRRYVTKKIPSLMLCQITVFLVGICGIILANLGNHMYGLLEISYSSSMSVLFAPLTIGLFGKVHCQKAIVVSMIVGTMVWLLDIFIFNFGFPLALIGAILSYISYYLVLPFSLKTQK